MKDRFSKWVSVVAERLKQLISPGEEAENPESEAVEAEAPETEVVEADVFDTDVPETEMPEADLLEAELPEPELFESEAVEEAVPLMETVMSDEALQEVLERFGWKPAKARVPVRKEHEHLESTAALPDLTEEYREEKPSEHLAEKEASISADAAVAAIPETDIAGNLPEPAEEAGIGHPEAATAVLPRTEDVNKILAEEKAKAVSEDDADEQDKTQLFHKVDPELAKEPEKKEPAHVRTRKVRNRPERKAAAVSASKATEYTERDFRPIRRRRTYRTGLRGGLMYFGFVICVSVIFASVGWLVADDVLSLNRDEMEAEVYVSDPVKLDEVATELAGKGIIRFRRVFILFGKLTKAESKIDPGVYTLSTRLDYIAMIHSMQEDTGGISERETVTLTIPEGKTLKQTFQSLAEHGVCPYETLLECAANHEFKYDFLEDIPYGDETRLEGYLFPDTYEFYTPSEPEEAINRFLENFDAKVTPDMREKAVEMGYSLHEIVTIASLIEMEAGNDTERATIASVIYNRLNSSYYPYLQIDATIQYALEERKEFLTEKDLAIDSPYNTYKYTGLPPGAIANPGAASIRAALNPESTGYYFYALKKSGVHAFFSNLSSFEYFVNSSDFGG